VEACPTKALTQKTARRPGACRVNSER
jgi:hypothetical protein